jgi:O-antigen/teichoic acid export membrane protein
VGRRVIFRYSLLQILGRFIPGLLAFFLAALLTRYLTPAEYGVYGLMGAIAQFVFIAAFGWLGLAVTRFSTASSSAESLLATAFALFAAISLIALAVGAIIALLGPAPDRGIIIAAAIAGGVTLAFFDLKCSFFSASFKFRKSLWFNVTRAGCGFVFAIAAARVDGSGLGVFLGTCGGVLVAAPFFRILPRRPPLRIDPQLVLRLLGFGLPLALSLVLFAISAWTDRLVLQEGVGPAAVGYYSAAAVIVQNTVQMIGSAVGSAALPLAVRAYETGRGTSREQLEQNLLVLCGCLIPAGIGLAAIAPNMAEVLIGPEFRQEVAAMTPILASAAVFNGVRANFVDHSFHISRKTRQFFWIALVAAIVNLVALLLLVPRYGVMGAAWASLLTAVTAFAHATLAARRAYPLPFPVREMGKLGAAVLMMVVVLEATAAYRGGLALVFQIASATLIYGAAIFSLNLGNLLRAVFSAKDRLRRGHAT